MTATEPRTDRRAVLFASAAVLVLVAAGASAVPVIRRFHLEYASLFYKQFEQIEPIHLLIIGLFTAVVVSAVIWKQDGPPDAIARLPNPPTPFRAGLIIGLFVLATTLVGTEVVFHRFLLADDEFAAWFQAQIFAHGRAAATLAPQWCRWTTPLTPNSIAVSSCLWRLGFLPLHSLFRSLFIAAHVEWLGGPLTAALSVLLVGAIARKAWPERPERAWIAMIALASSTQFLFMSMTMFSMSSHLLFSLIWIWCYIDNRRWSIIALPWVGFLALGLHSPVPHVLLIPAFLVRYARDRRWGVLVYLAAVYAFALMFWARQLGGAPAAASTALATPSATVGMAHALVVVPSVLERATTAMHLSLVLTWNTPLALLCLIAALLAWKRLDTFARDLALSFVFVLAARVVNPNGAAPQGEGWGYRYVYQALGSMALLAPWGLEVISDAVGKRRALRLALASLAASLFLQLPLRAMQVSDIIRPYREGSDWLNSRPEEIVAFPAAQLLWARQLVRNDPFLQKNPKIMDLSQLAPGQIDTLKQLYPGHVRIVQLDELTRFGIDARPVRFNTITWVPR